MQGYGGLKSAPHGAGAKNPKIALSGTSKHHRRAELVLCGSPWVCNVLPLSTLAQASQAVAKGSPPKKMQFSVNLVT